MLNKLSAFMAAYRGEKIVCAVSGGADSMALLWGMYLLKDKLGIALSAAHFNHHLRGAESDRDEAFVREFCGGYGIAFVAGSGDVTPGKKGLEAAAREARYGFLKTLSGYIATAHTADDNAETILMHLVRGTGLRGLGGITPVNGRLIRPMLHITRAEVLAFLAEYSVPYVEDSTNAGDDFLRNRLRHRIMPLLKQENPCLAENLSAMAVRLRQDAEALDAMAVERMTDRVSELQKLHPAIRSRVLCQHLLDAGVKEPEATHIALLEKVVFSENPSAKASFPGGITITRRYDTLCLGEVEPALPETPLRCPGVTELPGLRIICMPNEDETYNTDSFPVTMGKNPVVRGRRSGDSLRLSGGTKSVKKLLIDRKIPADRRDSMPVIADDTGVLLVAGIGGNLDRLSLDKDAIRIQIQYL